MMADCPKWSDCVAARADPENSRRAPRTKRRLRAGLSSPAFARELCARLRPVFMAAGVGDERVFLCMVGHVADDGLGFRGRLASVVQSGWSDRLRNR
jgi:hypothetical protein